MQHYWLPKKCFLLHFARDFKSWTRKHQSGSHDASEWVTPLEVDTSQWALIAPPPQNWILHFKQMGLHPGLGLGLTNWTRWEHQGVQFSVVRDTVPTIWLVGPKAPADPLVEMKTFLWGAGFSMSTCTGLFLLLLTLTLGQIGQKKSWIEAVL